MHYDELFYVAIRALNPQWFEKKIHKFTSKSSYFYDPKFDAQIHELAPQWFTIIPLNTKNPN